MRWCRDDRRMRSSQRERVEPSILGQHGYTTRGLVLIFSLNCGRVSYSQAVWAGFVFVATDPREGQRAWPYKPHDRFCPFLPVSVRCRPCGISATLRWERAPVAASARRTFPTKYRFGDSGRIGNRRLPRTVHASGESRQKRQPVSRHSRFPAESATAPLTEIGFPAKTATAGTRLAAGIQPANL